MNRRQRKKAAKKKAELEITEQVDSLCSLMENFASMLSDTFDRIIEAMGPVLETLKKWEKTRSFLVIAYNRANEIKMIEYKEKE